MLGRGIVLALALAAVPLVAQTQGGPIPVPLPLFPPNNWWNTDISRAPVDPESDALIQFIGPTRGLHPDFGGDAGDGSIYGFPYILVDAAQPKKSVTFFYDDESDHVGYPIPDQAITQSGWIEGGQPGNVDLRDEADRHILIVDRTSNHLYELYNVFFDGTKWLAGSGAFFDMNRNHRRPEGWTSADAAGLAILPGLVRYDEVMGPDEILHAFRVTVRATNGHVDPASHTAGSRSGAPKLGMRLRLKASRDLSSFPAYVQKIFRAMKTYGLIIADNGSDLYVSGAYDRRWNNDVLNPAFRALRASDFEVIRAGWKPPLSFVLTIPSRAAAGDALTATLTVYDSDDNVATGYRGTVRFTSTDGAATLPVDSTFTATDAGVHTFTRGFTFRTEGSRIVTVTDRSDPTVTGSRIVTVVPPSAPGRRRAAGR
ncbi:MAG TPA: hypothetical protein VNL91_07680 [Thermoanaerobaculia bacterium]|nr:hypothetical protein [Thermoanaerobaculia bacterium]